MAKHGGDMLRVGWHGCAVDYAALMGIVTRGKQSERRSDNSRCSLPLWSQTLPDPLRAAGSNGTSDSVLKWFPTSNPAADAPPKVDVSALAPSFAASNGLASPSGFALRLFE